MYRLLTIGFILLVAVANANPLILLSGSHSVVSHPINEDFISDTSERFTNINGTISVSGGAAHGAAWGNTVSYHETPTGSNDHWASATCSIDSSGYDSGCLLIGSNGTQYYKLIFEGGVIYIVSSNSNTISSYNGSYTAGTYNIAVQIDTDGSSHARFNLWVNGVKRITDISDLGDNVTRGQYVGIRIDRDNNNDDIVVDNLVADAGGYTP